MAQRRFYDRDPIVKKAVDSMFLFPQDIQRVIAGGFSAIAERDCKAQERMKEYKSLGTEKVLGLYKSKLKQRDYDQNPVVHQAMIYLMIMDPPSQVFLARKVLELVGFMQNYLKLCQESASEPGIESVEAISNTYVTHGAQETQAFIQLVEQEFKKKMEASSVEKAAASYLPSKKGDPGEAIESQERGMRIRGEGG